MPENYPARKLCSQPKPIMPAIPSDVGPRRANFIFTNGTKWANGTNIKYMFIEGPEPQWVVVRQAFQQWKDLGIGLIFTETTNIEEAMVRIGFDLSLGSWSYVGRDILGISKPDRTMNFGWDLTADSYGMTTALHEIGHTIGYQHEHQSPFSGIVWDTDAVYNSFSGSPNFWSKAMIDNNILNKMAANELTGSNWDSTSIMEYQFGPGLVLQPDDFKPGIFPPGTLSTLDVQGVKAFYPAISVSSFIKLSPLNSVAITAQSGQQANFSFTPDTTRKYTFQTIGEMDTVMVISEKGDTENYYLQGDDDSGHDRNTKIVLPLVKGREYLVNVRIVYTPDANGGAIVVV